MLVNQHTRIGQLLKQHPGALEAIAAISPKLQKLRNPWLRKLMAGRTSIRMAAKIAGCAENDFFSALRPLGFTTEEIKEEEKAETKLIPEFLQVLEPGQIVLLDVRPVLDEGNDPLKQILSKVKSLQEGQVLKIINTFEPTPLISMLKKKGYQSWTNQINPQHIETWFFKASSETLDLPPEPKEQQGQQEDWDQLKERFSGHLVEIDVRELEMPQPMVTILESLEELPQEKALYVVHKRMPVFLLQELSQRNFDFRSLQLSENEVHLLIFRN